MTAQGGNSPAWLDDDKLCPNAYPKVGPGFRSLCNKPVGHDGNHKALAEVAGAYRRYVVWTPEGQPLPDTEERRGTPAVQLVDPTAHRPGDCCEYCDDATFAADPTTCPGWLQHRTKQVYRVEGWEHDAWTMLHGPVDLVRDAKWHMGRLKVRFPETPMRVVAETVTYMVVATAPGQTPPIEGDHVT